MTIPELLGKPYVSALQQTAAAHREAGDPNNLANAIHAISVHI
jgi:hypothetical protein